jgi:hypothetical protein
VGLALFERVYEETRNDPLTEQERTGLAERALGLLLTSETALPPDLESGWALGILAAHLNRHVPSALQRLALVQAKAPTNADLAQAAALLHDRLAQSDQANEQLRLVARHAQSLQMRAWAVNRLRTAGTQGENAR